MGLIRRIRALLYDQKLSAELDEELRFHLAMREGLNKDAGMSETEARLAAERGFGNVTLLKETTREVDLFVQLETVLKDLHFAARMLAKQPAFTGLAVLALAIGIGVNTAVFTACKAVLLQPLDARNPAQLVNIYRSTQERAFDPSFSYPDFEFYRDHNHVFSGLLATTGGELAMNVGEATTESGKSISGGLAQAFGFRLPSVMAGTSQLVSVAAVSENYFAVLGISAIRGRVFLPQDSQDLDSHPAILISENFWQRRFGGDPSILGKSVKLNGAPFTIIGITPHDFVGTIINVPNIWIPMRLWPLASKDSAILHDREDTCCAMYGRLGQGVSLEQAQAEMNLLAAHVRTLHTPNSNGIRTATIRLTPGSHIGPVGGSELLFPLLLILGAVALVLLIACANVSSLQLARSAARKKEIGIRLSIGASRFRIIRQLLTESALLGLIAGATSLLMSWCALRLLMIEIAASLPTEWGAIALHVEPDLQVFTYVFILSLLASVLFGLAPALQSSRPNLSVALKEEGSAFAFRISGSRMRDLLMGAQAAACLFLLIGAGLLIRGSIRSMVLSPGFETKHILSMEITFPPGLGYSHAKQLADVQQLFRRIGNLPGVHAVSAGIAPDAGGLRTAAVGLNGHRPSTDKMARTLFYSYIAHSYFDCLSIPLLAGRTFSKDTGAAPEPSVVLSESAAAELWPGENPLAKKVALDASNQFHLKGELMPQGSTYEVIGVVKDTRAITPQGDDNRKAYLALPADRFDTVPLLLRFQGDSKLLLADLGKQLRGVDPNLVVYASTLEDLLTSTPTFVLTRLAAIFASIIGALGFVLACVGIYGTVSYSVARRTREVGVRMALGACEGDVLRMIIFESGRPVMLGLIVGTIAAAGASRLIQSLLFGLNPLDPITFLSVGLLFFAIALIAAYLPARRAAHIDPMVALRWE